MPRSSLPDRILMDQLVDRRLYRVQARNFNLGIWSSERRGFFGVRHKFGLSFVDVELHWDAIFQDRPGTAWPLEVVSGAILPPELALTEREPDASQLLAWLTSFITRDHESRAGVAL